MAGRVQGRPCSLGMRLRGVFFVCGWALYMSDELDCAAFEQFCAGGC